MKEQTFQYWLNSDNVVKVHKGYRTQCTQYSKLFSLEELKEYFNREYSV